jgi:hypothetical protein
MVVCIFSGESEKQDQWKEQPPVQAFPFLKESNPGSSRAEKRQTSVQNLAGIVWIRRCYEGTVL